MQNTLIFNKLQNIIRVKAVDFFFFALKDRSGQLDKLPYIVAVKIGSDLSDNFASCRKDSFRSLEADEPGNGYIFLTIIWRNKS